MVIDPKKLKHGAKAKTGPSALKAMAKGQPMSLSDAINAVAKYGSPPGGGALKYEGSGMVHVTGKQTFGEKILGLAKAKAGNPNGIEIVKTDAGDTQVKIKADQFVVVNQVHDSIVVEHNPFLTDEQVTHAIAQAMSETKKTIPAPFAGLYGGTVMEEHMGKQVAMQTSKVSKIADITIPYSDMEPRTFDRFHAEEQRWADWALEEQGAGNITFEWDRRIDHKEFVLTVIWVPSKTVHGNPIILYSPKTYFNGYGFPKD